MTNKAETVDWKYVGRQLNNLMEQHHVSVKKLAEDLHIGTNTIYQYRKGTKRIPLDVLEELMIYFDVPLEVFLKEQLQPKGECSLEYARRKLLETNLFQRIF